MKLFNVKVKIESQPGGGTKYIYPQEYWDCKLSPICYESEGDYASVKARKILGDMSEQVLCVCWDDHNQTNPDIQEIDQRVAESFIERCKKPDPITKVKKTLNDLI